MILSYSLINDYKICPRRCWHKWIARDVSKAPPSAEMKAGTDFHEAMAERLQKGAALPKHLMIYEPLATQIETIASDCGRSRLDLIVEQKLGIDDNGQPCDFFDNRVFFRGVLDVALLGGVHAWIGDWKTGNVREDPMELELHATLLLAHWPQLRSICGNYIWLKTNVIGQSYDLYSDNRHESILDLANRIKKEPLEKIATPGPLCRYCPVTRQQCMHKKG